MCRNLSSRPSAHVFHRTVQAIKARNAGTDPTELQAVIDESVREVRAEKRSKRPRGKTPAEPDRCASSRRPDEGSCFYLDAASSRAQNSSNSSKSSSCARRWDCSNPANRVRS